MAGTQRSLRGLTLMLTVLILGALAWIALAPGAGRGVDSERALAGALPPLDERAAVCYTIDTSRPEWLGWVTYLPAVLREY